jgi:hypothetical protein
VKWQKKAQLEFEVQGGELLERPQEYTIEAEVGQLEINTFEIKKGSEKVFSTKRDVFPETGPREPHKTVCFRELAVFYPCDETFRKSAQKLNRALRRKEGQEVIARTMANLAQREGEQIQAQVEKKAERILEDHGFTTDGLLIDQQKARSAIDCSDVIYDNEVVIHMIEEFNCGQEEEKHIDFSELHETFEDPKSVKANISIDDVCCKKQKASGRKKGSQPKEKREMVYNTVAHIQNKEAKAYTLNTSTIQQMMIIVLAFLLSNELMSKPGSLVFFTDGARDLRLAIQNTFRFLPFKIILDWHHLEKKCKDLLSMAIKGKQTKNSILSEMLAWLWLGNVDRAVKVLSDLKEDTIKNTAERDNLIKYLHRNQDCIPCYALRKKLGLRISSNPVEKANDLVVANRQKHNGMSWSADGSTSLATLTSLRRNDEHMHWLLHRDIPFIFPGHRQVKPAA